MKNTVLFAMAAMLVACGGTKNYENRLNELEVEWDRTYEDARGLSQGLGNAFSLFISSRQSLDEFAGNNANLSADERAQVDQLLPQIEDYNLRINSMMQEINNIAQPLLNRKPMIDQLRNALTNGGKYDGNMGETIEGLEEVLDKAKTGISDYESRLKTLRDDVDVLFKTVRTLTGEAETPIE